MAEQQDKIPVNIEDEMRTSYMAYAMSVIVGRALPDVRDGLKPVHRRILYAMHEVGNVYNRSYKKSARIVGDVIGKYHPHGDSAVYDALVRMAQTFSMRLPLVDGQGNFGSVDGDPPAAMRYTEVRMTRATSELLSDIEKETVDFGDNYDGSEQEPLVLPTRVPNLLINGSEGIAVGMATRIPPHNLGEVVSACIHLVDHPDATVEDLMEFVRGPDFPTAAMMYGLNGIRDAYHTGRGVVRLRARTHIETDERTNKDSIIVTELPFQVNKARLLEKIAGLVRDKSVEGITDLRDESDRTGMRMVIELRRDVNSRVLLNQLFKRTQLETSFGMNMLAIVGGQPRLLGLKDILGHFIDFRRDVVTRRSMYELKKAEERMHILRGLKKALDMIDEVIRTIRASADAEEANAGLRELLDIDHVQAAAILQMRLQRLTNLEINKLVDEMNALQSQIDRLNEILSNEVELLGVIRTELREILDAYREDRRTEILNIDGEISDLDLIDNVDEVVTLSHQGYVKRTPLEEYRTQRRGGKGLRGMATKDADFVENVWVTNTHASLLVFTSIGKCYRLGVHELPAGSRNAKGRPIVNLLPVESDEKIQAVVPFEDFVDGPCIITATRSGLIKKTPLLAYRNIHAGGIIGVNMVEGDELINVRLVNPGDRVLLVSREGQSIQFDESDTRPMGRATRGVRGIRFRDGDELVAMVVIPREELLAAGLAEPNEGEEIDPEIVPRRLLTITENGYGKRTELEAYPVQNRGGLGVITIKTTDRNGPVASCRLVAEDDQLIIITNGGQLIRIRVDGVSVLGRNTQGVRLINLSKDETVVGVARWDATDEDEEDGIEDGLVASEDGEGGDEESATGDDTEGQAEVAGDATDAASDDDGEVDEGGEDA